MSALTNPFAVTTPDSFSAKDAYDLFVDVFSEYPQILRPGHLFLQGPRGTGKSMMFRYLLPDCQIIEHKCSIRDLSFMSFYVPFKHTALDITELHRLDGVHGDVYINEHFLVSHISMQLFGTFAKHINVQDSIPLPEIQSFFKTAFVPYLRRSGYFEEIEEDSITDSVGYIEKIGAVCADIFHDVQRYIKRLALNVGKTSYEGPLLDYSGFLLPLLKKLRQLECMPDGPTFLLLDDADNLNSRQAQVLNSWVAARTTADLSLKISTQLDYPTYRTVSGRIISAPHDYSEIEISTTYTTNTYNNYQKRVKKIVAKRLAHADIDCSPEDFFPAHKKQQIKLKKKEEELRKRHRAGKGRGYRPGDDARRYAFSEYMKSLAGTSKSLQSYHYAGLEQLVHISSGVVRFFLDAATLMYNLEWSDPDLRPVTHVRPHIQDQAVRTMGQKFLYDRLDQELRDKSPFAFDKADLDKLYNLIHVLGGSFKMKLLSDDAERSVFSIAISNTPSDEVRRVLTLGAKLGFFHISTIGNKEGTGRTRLYILTRMLAPHFNLDPTGFAGYLFVTNRVLEEAMANPDTTLRRVKEKGVEEVFDLRQLTLFP